MKRSILRLTVILAVSVVIVAGLLATASPAWANGPIEISGPSGYTRLGGSPVERQFEVPAGYSSDGLIIGRKKEGHPERGCTPALKEKQIHSSCDQLQDNEEIRVLVNGQVCFELRDQNPLDDRWFDFEHTCSGIRAGTNVLRIEHTGRGTSVGSVHFEMALRVEPVEEAPVSCDLLSVTPQNGFAPLTVSVAIAHTNGQDVRLNWGDGQLAQGLSSASAVEHTYNQAGDYTLTAEVQDRHGHWLSSAACTAQVNPRETVKGTVTALKVDENNQAWAGVTVKLYRADGSLVTEGKTPANFANLELGDYFIEEIVPPNSEPISPTRFDFSLTEQAKIFTAHFQNRRLAPTCQVLQVTPRTGLVPLTVEASHNQGTFESIDWGDGSRIKPEVSSQNLNGQNQVDYTYTEPGRYQIVAEVKVNGVTTLECTTITVNEEPTFRSGQYQDFTGPVAFGTYTPHLEPGKEYFDSTRSLMFNVEYLNGQQGDLVYRFNGQEIDEVTSSLFNSGGFQQVTSHNGRAVTELAEGVTKLIAYRFGQEQARIFQTVDGPDSRWIKPLDQPFEHKYNFELQLHGPASTTDRLVYGREVQTVQYDAKGQATVNLTFDRPGLVAVYALEATGQALQWLPVEGLSYPEGAGEAIAYQFAETGLHYYRIIDQNGQIVAGPSASARLSFSPQPGANYQAQLVYPVTSLFVGLYDDMKFQHPDSWLMPVDGRQEHDVEFHLDYHRLPDPDLGNDHIRGDIVVDGLTLSYGTTSVAQQFPYGRHDGARPGVNIAGIPNVSMVAFCQRPGYHEVVYWGGWENESYYLPERAWVFDQDLADDWNEDQRGECIDAARRVNMELARQGLRTDHTFRHHGERSQGYQMVQQQIWSPYNLVGMRPPHLGQILKPGTVLGYYENPEDALFWGWDLAKGSLKDGIGAYELQAHVASLGPAQYVDMTGIHPADQVYVPDFPAQPAAEPVAPAKVEPAQPQQAPTPTPTEPVSPTLDPTPVQPEPTPAPAQPEPTPEPPFIVPVPAEAPQL